MLVGTAGHFHGVMAKALLVKFMFIISGTSVIDRLLSRLLANYGALLPRHFPLHLTDIGHL